jgi:hypothetical protein
MAMDENRREARMKSFIEAPGYSLSLTGERFWKRKGIICSMLEASFLYP